MSRFGCFFFNDTATTEIYTLSLHDALPISGRRRRAGHRVVQRPAPRDGGEVLGGRGVDGRREPPRGRPAVALAVHVPEDRKSTRLNSSHANISYAVFCLKKKKTSFILHHNN